MRRRADSPATSPPIWWSAPTAGPPSARPPAAPPEPSGPVPQQDLPWHTAPPPPLAQPIAADGCLEPTLAALAITPLPVGHWLPGTRGADGAAELWMPGPPPASAAASTSAIPAAPLDLRGPALSAAQVPAVPTRVRPSDTPSANGRPRPNVERPFAAVDPVDPAEAAQLATTFSMDYLSWDEEQPWRRSEVLRRYLPTGADTTLGWSGDGRQRADFACPGQVKFVEFCLWVDVRVRVTPYQRTDDPLGPAPETRLPDGAIWSSAPAPVAVGWQSGPSAWMRLAVPVRRHDSGGLVVDLSTIPEPDPNEGHQQ